MRLWIIVSAASVIGFGLVGAQRMRALGGASMRQKVPAAGHLALTDDQLLQGDYYFGDGLGVNCHLNLLANHRFTFRWTGCLGEYDKNEGAWEIRGDMLILHPEKENKHEGFEGVNVCFTPVLWNKRLFLVDEYEAPGFCSTLGSTTLPTNFDQIHGTQYIKVNKKYEAIIFDRPDYVDERFMKFVGKPRIRCTITGMLSDGNFVIDKGSDSGLRPGLRLGPEEWYSGDLEVVSVSAKNAVAKAGYFFNSERLVQIGDRYSTGGAHGSGWPWLARPPKS